MKPALPAFLICCLIALPALAARPFATDDASTVPQGAFELEAATDFWPGNQAAAIVFKHGITSRMDLGLAMGHTSLPRDKRGFGHAELGLKYSLIPDLLSASFTGCLADPCYGINFISSRQLIESFAINANLGFAIVAPSNNADFTYGMSGIYSHSRFSLGLETAGTNASIEWWQCGARVSVVDWLAIDAGIGGDFEKNINLTATTGLWITFPVAKE